MNPKRAFALLLVLAVILAGVTLWMQNTAARTPADEPATTPSAEPSETPAIYEIGTQALVHEELSGNSTVGRTMLVAGDHVNQRADASTNSQIQLQRLAGEAVTVVGQVGDWYKLDNGDYISVDYLVDTYDEVIARMHENHQDLIAVSISRQQVQYWYYGEMIASGKIVSGDPNNSPTPLGLYWITSRQTDVNLMGDEGKHADFFCTFNGQIGFHDAVWNPTDFGGTYYQTAGSHGCIRCEYELAKAIFEHCRVNYTAVLVMP